MREQTRLRAAAAEEELFQLGQRVVRLRFVRNDNARRYILRLSPEGYARVTLPRRGSLKAAREFLQRHLRWLERQLEKQASRVRQPDFWKDGTEILFRGEPARVQVDSSARKVQFADQVVAVRETEGNLREVIELHMWNLAASELVPRTFQWASLHQLRVGRVTVRNQRWRWGSCSMKKTISLNWRLIQTPESVCDYIILHELMHLREMNHSSKFWQQVQRVCPDYRDAEAWLNQHDGLLRV